MKKIFITGVTGFLGARVAELYQNKYYDVINATRADLDFTDGDKVREVISDCKPDLFIHCGAMSVMSECEAAPELSYKVNVEGVEHIGKACAENGVKLIFCSSEQVYNATPGFEPFKETAPLTPNYVYAKQKVEAEERLTRVCPDAVSLRLSWMYDKRKLFPNQHGNYWDGIKKAVEENLSLTYSINDYRGVTYVKTVVDNLEKTFTLPGGAYNFGSMNTLSSYELAKFAVELLGGSRLQIRKAEFEGKERPLKSLRMDQTKINAAGILFPSAAEGLAMCLND